MSEYTHRISRPRPDADEQVAQAREFRTQIGALQDAVLLHERDLLRLMELSVATQKLCMAIEERLKLLEKREQQYVR